MNDLVHIYAIDNGYLVSTADERHRDRGPKIFFCPQAAEVAEYVFGVLESAEKDASDGRLTVEELNSMVAEAAATTPAAS